MWPAIATLGYAKRRAGWRLGASVYKSLLPRESTETLRIDSCRQRQTDSLFGPQAREANVKIAIHQDAVVKVGRLLGHLLQMVLAMAIGMGIFGVLLRALLTPTGYLAFQTQAPLLWFGGMAVFMTVPMVVLMRYYHAHSWWQCAEMTGAMLVPPAAVAALIQFGVEAYPWLAVSTLSASTHTTMLLGMTALMLYRHDQYAWSPGER
jgi:hypothetical protein